MANAVSSTWAPRALSLLRIVSAYLFMLHGTAKHLKMPAVETLAKVPALSPSWFAGWFELIGGALLLVGLFSRPVAFVLSGVMAFAYFLAHASSGTFLLPILNRGEAAILYCFVFLYISAAGPGPWSIDAMRSKRAF